MPRPLPIRSLPLRMKLSAISLVKLLYFKPAYLLMAVGVSVVFYEFIFWFLNLGLLQYLLASPYLSIQDKFGMLTGSYSGIFTLPFSPLALMLFLVSIFQGISVSALVYTMRQERLTRRTFLKDFSGTGFAGVLSVLGLGCAACGTSLVTPIVTFLFATSSVAVAEAVGLYAAMLALIVSIVTVYLTGLKVSSRLKV